MLYEDPIKLPKKQTLNNLDTVLNEANYATLPPQKKRELR